MNLQADQILELARSKDVPRTRDVHSAGASRTARIADRRRPAAQAWARPACVDTRFQVHRTEP